MKRSLVEVILVAAILGIAKGDLPAVPDVLSGEPADCSCSRASGGCIISVAAPTGFKCRCRYYKLFRTCSGAAFPCVGEEKCPGNLADYCACELGGGDCGGYSNPVTECNDSGRVSIGVAGIGSCNCKYHKGGCTISEAAPFGWKCVCRKRFFWFCRGRAQQCAVQEVCNANDFSYCGCLQGGGNCGGYPDRPTCHSPTDTDSCDCTRSSDWNRGLYTVEAVTYNFVKAKLDKLGLVVLAQKTIPNYSSETQSILFESTETLAQTSSFSRTKGIEIAAGLEFKAFIPQVVEGTLSLTPSISYSHTYGESQTVSTLIRGSFTCNGAPYKTTKCTVTIQKGNITVPYIMAVKHKVIPNCACESYGVWSGAQFYNSTLQSEDMDNNL